MEDRQRRKLETVSRLDDFGVAHSADFAANSVAKQLFTDMSNITNRLAVLASSQATGHALTRHGTATRAIAREDLRADVDAICRTAHALADEIPGIEAKFPFPDHANDQELLAAARSIAENAVAFSAQFIALELPATFLEDLNADIQTMETAISNQATGRGKRAAARAEMNDALESADAVRRKLHAIVKNKYANDPGVLAEWLSASHTVRAPRHSQAQPPPTQAPSGQTSTNPA